METGKKITVRTAVIRAMESMPPQFSALAFNARVRELCNRPQLMDTSISATMRRCRAAKEINFECVDYSRAIYQKKAPGMQTSIFDRISKIGHA
jgi:hypothetical protein